MVHLCLLVSQKPQTCVGACGRLLTVGNYVTSCQALGISPKSINLWRIRIVSNAFMEVSHFILTVVCSLFWTKWYDTIAIGFIVTPNQANLVEESLDICVTEREQFSFKSRETNCIVDLSTLAICLTSEYFCHTVWSYLTQGTIGEIE